MEGIHSYEQRSLSEVNQKLDFKQNRVIIVNRHEPNVSWSTTNTRPTESRGIKWFSSIFKSKPTAPVEQPPVVTNNATHQPSPDSKVKATTTTALSIASTATTTTNRSASTSSISAPIFDSGPFPSNELRTSKYTLVNFLPKNLFEQFRRLANFYFLTTAILQLAIPFSPVGPLTSLLPLFFVVSTTAIKQAYEDYLRHKLDKEVNNRFFHVLRNKHLIKIRSKDIRVGDFVYVRNNEEIPCDMILLATSGHGDRCYITTANLDGETSLKSRTCFQIREQVGTIERLDDTLLVIECERPNATLYEFNGYLHAPKNKKSYDILVGNLRSSTTNHAGRTIVSRGAGAGATSSSSSRPPARSSSQWSADSVSIVRTILRLFKQTSRSSLKLKKSLRNQQDEITLNTNLAEYHEIPLDITNLLLRASRLRNTQYVYGLAVYTGRDTKLAYNSQVKPNKFSSTESKVNIFLIVSFILLMLFSIIGALRYHRPNYWFFDGLTRTDSFEQILIAHFLLYNYLVPISLYVTLEFVKFFGTISVVDDDKMKAAVWQSVMNAPSADSTSVPQQATKEVQKTTTTTIATNQTTSGGFESVTSQSSLKKVKVIEGAKCNSSDLNEELGQVEVLFSDKTGTLTENNMRFMACSAYGQLYRSITEQLYLQPAEMFKTSIPDVAQKLAQISTNRHVFLAPMTSQSRKSQSLAPLISSTSVSSSSPSLPKSTKSHHLRNSQATPRPFDHRYIPPLSKLKLVDDMEKEEQIVEFFTCLCLCSTITLNETLPIADCLPDKTQNEYDFQAASPDEASLISAAHLYGITMCKSNDHECYIVIERNSPSFIDKSKDDKSSSTHKSSDDRQNNPLPPNTDKFKAIVDTKNSNGKYIVRHFERLVVFEFNSVRKRMSVLYRDCDNDCILMVTKGSEELLDCIKLTQLQPETERCINVTLAHFEAFAKSGLRTLLVARRVIGQNEYEKVVADMKEARLSIQNRDHMLDLLYKRVESGLTLIGTTAVEDTLQEGVPETIANLKDAGIKVWLLTGDKVETAISVAYLCKLLERDMVLFHLVRQQDAKACQTLLKSINERMKTLRDEDSDEHNQQAADAAAVAPSKTTTTVGFGFPSSPSSKVSPQLSSKPQLLMANNSCFKFALIADGRSLYYAMKYGREELASICKQCTCVLGCRLSPLQKAEIVDMIKKSEDKPITAAIGDGANDVSMIQEAHVGIGVSGKEGRQAVNCSDFAINRFFMLNRLFFVHGHLFYHRTANTIHYFFYKNLLFILPQFLYSFYNLSSAQSLYHPILLVGYNLFFTSLPILLYGLFEVHIPEAVLENHPKLYRINRGNSQMGISVFISWLTIGAIQSLIGFYMIYFNWGSHTPFLESGKLAGINGFSTMLYFVIIFTATFKLYFLSKSHTLYFNIGSIASCLLLPIFFYGYSLVDWSLLADDNSLYGQFLAYIKSPMFWLAVVSTTTATLLPDIIWYVRNRIIYFRRLDSIMCDS